MVHGERALEGDGAAAFQEETPGLATGTHEVHAARGGLTGGRPQERGQRTVRERSLRRRDEADAAVLGRAADVPRGRAGERAGRRAAIGGRRERRGGER